jgi:hypothetical protein
MPAPWRCATVETSTIAHCHVPAAGANDTLTLACGQVVHQEMQMMKLVHTVGAALAMSALLVALSGCQKQEGPAEHAGKQIDKSLEKAGQQMEKAGDSIQDAAKGDKK